MALFDTHAHLSDARFDPDREDALERAFAADVTRVMEIGDSPADWDKVLALSASRPGQVGASLGFHPHYAQDFNEAALAGLRDRATRFSAVGEIGLDYVVSTAPKETQIPVFRRLLTLAVELEKPVVIHCREAFVDLFPALEEFAAALGRKGPPGVIHCFSGGPAEADRAAALGFFMGVDGPVTYPKNESLRAALKGVGLDRLVLETDSPYLPPQKLRGQRNEPARIVAVAERLAELFSVPLSEVAEKTWANAHRLFRLPAAKIGTPTG